MIKAEAKIRVKQLLREAHDEMVRQNQKCSISRSYARADQLIYLANQYRDTYDI